MNPLVSVLIPFRNTEPYLQACLESILNSSYKNFEILLVDDYSTDKSPLIAKSFAQRDERLSILTPDKQGLVPALNTGLKAAKGKYIARMDSDDICHKHRLQKQVEELNNHPHITLTSCRVKCFSEEGLTEGFLRYIHWVNSCLVHEQIQQGMFIESPFVHPSVMFRRQAVLDLGGYRDYAGPEDFDLWIRLAEKGHQFSKLPETLLDWRIYANSFSRTDSRYSPKAFENRKFKHLLFTLSEQLPRVARSDTLYIMGAGKRGGRLGRYLLENKMNLKGFIDVDPAKQAKQRQGLPVISPEEFFKQQLTGFVVGYVTSWGARETLQQELIKSGRETGRDFIIM